MTAICAGHTKSGLVIASDGAQYDMNTGILDRTNMSKVNIWPALNMTVGSFGCGPLGVAFNAAVDLSSPEGFDQVVYNAPTLLAHAFKEVRKAHPGMLRRHYDGMIFLAGLSEQRSVYEMYMLSTHLPDVDGDPPYTLQKLKGSVFLSATSQMRVYSEFQVDSAAIGACKDDNDMCRLLGRGICAARQMSGALPATRLAPDGGPETFHFAAGGMIQLTRMEPFQVHSSVLYRWPEDKPGEVLDPTKGEARPAALWEGVQ